jgi:hypothetical protein
MTNPAPETPPARSPFAGCAIMLILASVALFLIASAVYSLFRQNAEIAKFTEATPATLPEIVIEGRESALNALDARLQLFRDSLISKTDTPVTLELSVEDLNFALATMKPFRDYRGHFFVKEIRQGEIVADHTRLINGLPGSGEKRFLNGEIVLKPILSEKTLAFQVQDLVVPNQAVPREFIAQIPPFRFGVTEQQDPVLGPVLQQLTAMEAKPGVLELRRIPGEITTATASDEQVDSAFLRILRVLICGFLIVVGLGLFFALRAKAKRASSSQNPR